MYISFVIEHVHVSDTKIENKNDKETADVYFKLFRDCLKYKNMHKDKKIECDIYYEWYKKFCNSK